MRVVILGYGYLTEPIIKSIEDSADYSLLTPKKDEANRLIESGYENIYVGDPTNEEKISELNIQNSDVAVIASENDADDALSILTVTEIKPDLRIIAVASNEENIKKLRRAGADIVISPARIAGKLLVESALTGEDTEELLKKIQREIN